MTGTPSKHCRFDRLKVLSLSKDSERGRELFSAFDAFSSVPKGPNGASQRSDGRETEFQGERWRSQSALLTLGTRRNDRTAIQSPKQMTPLLFPELLPTTFSIGFVESSFAKVKNEYVRWRSEAYAPIESKELELPLEKALPQLLPLSSAHVRWLFTPTTGDWVAYFDNGIRGSDPAPVVSYLSQKLRCRGLAVHVIPHTRTGSGAKRRGLHGIVQFQLFAEHQTEFPNFARAVSVAYDRGKWRFAASGVVQEFEEVSQYDSRRVVDRFTPAMLQRYCKALGVDLCNAEFYKAPSFLCWADGPWIANHPHYDTLDEAQRFLGLGEAGK